MPESPIERIDFDTEPAIRDYNFVEISSAVAVSMIGGVVLGGTAIIDKIINHDAFKSVKKEFTMLASVAKAIKNGTPKI